jgi:superoxide dismutase, Fe-Mn family
MTRAARTDWGRRLVATLMRSRAVHRTIDPMPYDLPPLPYPYDALAPTIDERTMRVHHGKHHAGCVTMLNAALDGSDWADRPVEDVLANLGDLPQDVRDAVRANGGDHANHSLYWESMAPHGGGEPAGALAAAIEARFASARALRERLAEAGALHVGSGWVWLVHDGAGLAVSSTHDQDSPLMHGHTPLLGIDLWEHAYYLKHQNRRSDYLEAWWNVVDWDRVAERFARVGT